jgi:hypothetical protein
MSTTGKKLAIGVLAILCVLVVGAAIAGMIGYHQVYVPLLRPVSYVAASARLDDSLENATPFHPSASGAVTPDQWARYCEVKAAVRAALGPSSRILEEQARWLAANMGAPANTVELRAALRAIGEIGPAFLGAKYAQVKALNRAHFSIEEYRWVQRQVFGAANLALAELDIRGMETAPQERREAIVVTVSASLEVGQVVKALVRTRPAAELESWRALAFFGL